MTPGSVSFTSNIATVIPVASETIARTSGGGIWNGNVMTHKPMNSVITKGILCSVFGAIRIGVPVGVADQTSLVVRNVSYCIY